MGKLVKGTSWAREQFEKGSRPGKEKILDWIEAEHIPGQIIDGEPYVDADRFAIRDHTGKTPAQNTSANDSQPKSGMDLLAG
ncbi:hypothetical protein [Microbulbifer sp. GL-2]|uniref:hypothetical protein n=1 Tax=Microbulbifer sp. GL-2 TaxID=2591606 RepID=UPI00116477E2|nr:hypothetical protein [Microbulbifer sp. GL-2]BBM00479.1 hypothetical protein GL2_05530 [Microbulbifer sp. GL-2]